MQKKLSDLVITIENLKTIPDYSTLAELLRFI